MQITWVPIQQVRPYAKNPRRNQRTVAKLAQSLKAYGWQQPLVVDKDQVIIVGHARWQAALQLGMATVPVHCAQALTDAQARSYRLADNRVAEESRWDVQCLGEELAALRALEVDLALTGFREAEITACLGPSDVALTDACEVVPALPTTVVSRRGDVWQLGPHRVMCGDAAQHEDVAHLMDGSQADLVFTDPPYNVNYQRRVRWRQPVPKTPTPLCNDDLSAAAYDALLKAALGQAAVFSKKEASLYLCHTQQYITHVQAALETAGFSIRSVLVWAKQHFVLSYARYKHQHEVIFYAHHTGQTDAWYGGNTQSTLWCFDRPLHSDLHPTMKPVALVQQALENSSLPGDRVLDLFGGAGSTLMACHYTQRQAFVLEIAPSYVDVMVRRWQSHTQGTATLVGDGRSFAALEQARGA